MRAILTDGATVRCGGYKAIDSGVVLTEDEDRDDVIGFVPHDELRYVLPDPVVDREGIDPPSLGRDDDGRIASIKRTIESAERAAAHEAGRDGRLERRVERLEQQFDELLDRLHAALDEPTAR